MDCAYVRRALFVSLVSFLTVPFRLYERARYSGAVKKLEIEQAPIFIIGHWRSGTTHLHYLICQDKNLGYVSTFQAIAPELFLVGNKLFRPLLTRLMPSRRIMDNMVLSLDGPQEEEIGPEEIEVNVLLFYREILQRFLAEKDLIPPGNLVEVRFEDLEVDPLAEFRRVYVDLGLPGFSRRAGLPRLHCVSGGVSKKQI